jgi:tetratricopeptide (TPR) repeat protein
VECRIEAATHAEKAGNFSGWQTCGTCKLDFTGEMKLGLLREKWRAVQSLPEADPERVLADVALGDALSDVDPTEAVALLRKAVRSTTRMCGTTNHPAVHMASASLAAALRNQGNLAEAEAIFKRTHADLARSRGSDDVQTLNCAGNLAAVLHDQGKLAKALAVYQANLTALKSKLGPNDVNTLRTAMNVAVEFVELKRFNEAEAVCLEHLPVMKRVLGPEHPLTMKASTQHARCRYASGQHGAAEAILVDTLAAQQRVLGHDHPSTLNTASWLSGARAKTL